MYLDKKGEVMDCIQLVRRTGFSGSLLSIQK
jgi:hypothetical protein